MKSTKNSIQLFVLSLINLAIGPCAFADGTAGQIGGGTPQENADLANGVVTPTYGFENQLNTIIMKQIEASAEVSLSDAAVDNADLRDESNPLYKLATSITSEFSQWFAQHGITPDVFTELPTSVEGELVDDKAAEAAGNQA